jgi:hypothetical protein
MLKVANETMMFFIFYCMTNSFNGCDDELYSAAWLCSILYLACDMGLHYLTFMARNFKSRRNLKLLQILNRSDVNSKNILHCVNIFKVFNSVIVLL